MYTAFFSFVKRARALVCVRLSVWMKTISKIWQLMRLIFLWHIISKQRRKCVCVYALSAVFDCIKGIMRPQRIFPWENEMNLPWLHLSGAGAAKRKSIKILNIFLRCRTDDRTLCVCVPFFVAQVSRKQFTFNDIHNIYAMYIYIRFLAFSS